MDGIARIARRRRALHQVASSQAAILTCCRNGLSLPSSYVKQCQQHSLSSIFFIDDPERSYKSLSLGQQRILNAGTIGRHQILGLAVLESYSHGSN